MIVVYINYVVENVSRHVSLFTDNAKFLRWMEEIEDCEELQRILDKVCGCSNTWQMDFN